jgi:hypothetical protein
VISPRFPIPRKVAFGLGYVIKVLTVESHEFEQVYNDFVADEGADDTDSFFEPNVRVIYLRRERNRKQRIKDYTHELGHAALDFLEWARDNA